MKIAAFYSDSPFAGWVQCEGFAEVLRRMGHDVTAIAIPPVTKVTQEMAAKVNKPIDDAELIMVSGPEHLHKWIKLFYPNWNKIKAPKVGWYHESFVREDYTLNYADYQGMFDFHFFPDKADAEKYKGEWLPLGVDIEMFHPPIEPLKSLHHYGCECLVCKEIGKERDIDVGFIGLMYPKRARFVEELKPHLGDINIQMRYGMQSERGLIPAIGVWDFDGFNIRRSMELLAETYRRIKVFVTFPSLSNVLVAKVLESMACGCRLVAPEQPIQMEGCYFPYVGAYQCAEQIRTAMKASTDASQYVHREHCMELRFEQIFKKVGICESSSLVPVDSSAII